MRREVPFEKAILAAPAVIIAADLLGLHWYWSVYAWLRVNHALSPARSGWDLDTDQEPHHSTLSVREPLPQLGQQTASSGSSR